MAPKRERTIAQESSFQAKKAKAGWASYYSVRQELDKLIYAIRKDGESECTIPTHVAELYKKIITERTDNESECPICYEKMTFEESELTTCGHIFHKSCLKSALEMNKSCPMCRHKSVSLVAIYD